MVPVSKLLKVKQVAERTKVIVRDAKSVGMPWTIA
jgi:hypothetical protein